MPSRMVGLAALLGIVACFGSRGPGAGRDRDVIGEEEIASVESGTATAYDIIARLRSDFLRSRGTVTRTTAQRPTQVHPTITVFVDDVESGPAERALHLIPANTIAEIRLYRPADAATRYGTRHNGGVIAIRTRRPEP